MRPHRAAIALGLPQELDACSLHARPRGVHVGDDEPDARGIAELDVIIGERAVDVELRPVSQAESGRVAGDLGDDRQLQGVRGARPSR